MGMSLSVSSLYSRATRISAAGSTGIRTFKPSSHGTQSNSDGGIIGSIINAAARFVGWVVGKLFSFISRFISWSLSAIWGYFCQAVSYIWRFEWNQPDDAMNQSLQSAWNAFGGTLGGAVGNTLGNLIVLGGSATLFAFNEAMAVYVLKRVGEEALEELASQAASVMQALVPLAANWLFKKAYMKVRTAIGLNPDAAYKSDEQITAEVTARVQAGQLTQAQGNELIAKNKQGRDALKAERKPFSFANKWEEYVESVQKDNPFWGNFIEEAFEETLDAIQSMGYVAFGAIDSYVAEHKLGHTAATGQGGPPMTVELTLDRSLDPTPTPTPTPSPTP